jgi:hypothetical protein
MMEEQIISTTGDTINLQQKNKLKGNGMQAVALHLMKSMLPSEYSESEVIIGKIKAEATILLSNTYTVKKDFFIDFGLNRTSDGHNGVNYQERYHKDDEFKDARLYFDLNYYKEYSSDKKYSCYLFEKVDYFECDTCHRQHHTLVGSCGNKKCTECNKLIKYERGQRNVITGELVYQRCKVCSRRIHESKKCYCGGILRRLIHKRRKRNEFIKEDEFSGTIIEVLDYLISKKIISCQSLAETISMRLDHLFLYESKYYIIEVKNKEVNGLGFGDALQVSIYANAIHRIIGTKPDLTLILNGNLNKKAASYLYWLATAHSNFEVKSFDFINEEYYKNKNKVVANMWVHRTGDEERIALEDNQTVDTILIGSKGFGKYSVSIIYSTDIKEKCDNIVVDGIYERQEDT